MNHVSKGDLPLYMTYGGDMTLPSKDAGHGIHHPVYGVKMKELREAAGVECYLLIPKTSTPDKYPSPTRLPAGETARERLIAAVSCNRIPASP